MSHKEYQASNYDCQERCSNCLHAIERFIYGGSASIEEIDMLTDMAEYKAKQCPMCA